MPATTTVRTLDADHCYRVASSRDGRFDGTFVTAVLTTGIYCRPSCPAVTPRRHNVRFYTTPAAAQEAGFRACKRCRPDAAPGSPQWNIRADVVARTVRLIGDGVVERDGVEGLARRIGYSPRHLSRLLTAEIGTGPLRLAVAHRVQSARTLLETTDLSVTDVAWAAGFGSIRQFNDVMRRVYAQTPAELRQRAARPVRNSPPTATATAAGAGETIVARLTYRPPLDVDGLLGFLGARAIAGVESYDGRAYTTALRLPHGLGVASVSAPSDDRGRRDGGSGRPGRNPYLLCELRLDDIRDYSTAVARIRRLLDLDSDPQAVDATLAQHPLLAPLIASRPGLRVPGAADPSELALRAVVGQQVSLSSARATWARLAERLGEPLKAPFGPIERAFPAPEAVAKADPADLPMPASRARALQALSAALIGGELELHPGADRDRAEAALLSLPGVGPWTAAYVRMRALGDPDVVPPGDAAIKRALTVGPTDCRATWSPWSSYATVHLWALAATIPPRPSRKGDSK